MKDRGRSNAAAGGATVANSLVLAQVVLSLVLVVGAGLFLRTFGGLTRVPLGFDRDRVLLAEIDTRRADLTPAARQATYERIRQRVLPSPASTRPASRSSRRSAARCGAGASKCPARPVGSTGVVDGPEGFGYTERPIPRRQSTRRVQRHHAGLDGDVRHAVAGRTRHHRADGSHAPRVALVNQAFARKFLDGANPVGHTVRATRDAGSPVIEIVGLLSDAVYRSVREPILPTVYVPLSQSSADEVPPFAPADVTLSVRAALWRRARSSRPLRRRSARSTRRWRSLSRRSRRR